VNMEDFAIFASHWLEESRPVVSTVRDNFDAISYSGNNGSTAWNDSWTEAGENDGPTVGLIQVLPKKNLFLGADQVYSPYVCSLTRSVNLGGATWATLSYDYSMEKGSNSGYIYVQLSNDGGVTWTTLSTLTSGSGSGSTSLDIAAYVSANTKIRFELHPERRLRLKAHIDNVQVEFDDRTQQCVPWADNCDINRDFKVDTADLVEFASRWLIGI
jgi:hypothetical protein